MANFKIQATMLKAITKNIIIGNRPKIHIERYNENSRRQSKWLNLLYNLGIMGGQTDE